MHGRLRRLWLAGVLGLALVLQFLFTPAAAQALSWSFQGKGAPPPPRSGARPALQRLQEVPPPEWVQKLQGVLEERDPKVRILSPAADSLLPEGPWTLRLQVSDWPLVDAGPLGLGPHLVVQLDGQLPIPIVKAELDMPPLTPGSHLLTVYAAKPWGEAHKGPSARQQIRLHRLAKNPATLPAPDTPQLVPVSPIGPAGDPPLLLDWLLLDAPLQGLRTDSLGWRLRVTVNGESVLLDRQTPLWLKGWQPGSNALLLELLDGRGEPLNPPFNSLLQEVIVPGAGQVKRPPSGTLTELELAVLLGDQPLSTLLPPPPPGDVVPQPPAPEAQTQEEPLVLQEATTQEPMTQEPAAQEPTAQEDQAEQEPTPDATDSGAVPQPIPDPEDQPSLEAPPSATSQPMLEPLMESTVDSGSASPSLEPPDPPPTVIPPATVPAREEVNPDGTLQRPSRSSALEPLKQGWSR